MTENIFDPTINNLKSLGHIEKDDIVIACIDQVSTGTVVLFGAIGAAIASSKADTYIMAINGNGITLFDVDKKTGAYLGTQSRLTKEEIVKAGIKGGLGSFSIMLKITSEKRTYSTSNKFRGRHQKEEIEKIKEFLKSNFQ